MVEYSVGLDIGTGSVGFVAMDTHYRLMRAKGKNIIGVRLFDPAKTAEERRGYRTTRRRLSRRRWRIGLLNSLFEPEFQASDDPNFLHRLKYSWVHPEDEANNKNYSAAPLFDDSEMDRAFYRTYPTIYHLRQTLMQDTKKHDLREVYLAIHHIVKYRGNFLWGDGSINQDQTLDIEGFIKNTRDFYEQILPGETIIDEIDPKILTKTLLDQTITRSDRVKKLNNGKNKKAKAIFKAILNGLVGNTMDVSVVLQKEDIDKDERKDWKLKFTDGDIDEKIDELIGEKNLSDAEVDYLMAIHKTFDGIMLRLILGDNRSFSDAMVQSFEDHKNDWAFIRANLRTASNKQQMDNAYHNLHDNDEKKRKPAVKFFKELIENTTQIDDERRRNLLRKIENENFLPVQRSKNNVTLPHQLHLHELHQIIEHQKVYYPFLAALTAKNENKIEQLVKFRIPYYVGPLVEAKTVEGDGSNHWMHRLTSGPITPWNFNEKVDRDQAALDFIKRMIGTDTYLVGEPALPKNSLAYQEYNVLQELNNVRVDNRRLEVNQKQSIFENVFKVCSSVSAKNVSDYLKNEFGKDVTISGLADTTGHKFNNQLTTYHYLLPIMGRAYLEDPKHQDTLESIVELQTVFEDRKILKKQLTELTDLTTEQIEKLAKHHVTGWGRLSKKLLTSKIVKKVHGPNSKSLSILETLYQTRMNLMEIIGDSQDTYGVRAWIDQQNSKDTKNSSLKQVITELAGPKEIKRGILQSFHILDEITRAIGNPPETVYLEFARETQASKLTNSRLNYLKKLYGNAPLNGALKELAVRLKTETKESIQDDRLYLYYLQQGKDMYTGSPINIDHISRDYQIDHIIPQAYTKDNSLDNRVLVGSVENARKSDSPIYLPELIQKNIGWWRELKRSGLISERKFSNLTRNTADFSTMQKERFIARSLVETRQIIRNVSNLIKDHFDGQTQVQAIRSEVTSDMRRYVDIPKNRDINDYHHAFDALLITAAGEFINKSGLMSKGRLSDHAGNVYNRYIKDTLTKARTYAEYHGNNRIKTYGFVVGAMASEDAKLHTNQETGEITWNEADVAYLRKVMDFKKIMVTKLVHDQKGSLYNETRYSRESGKGKEPFSKDKSLELYGGFSSAGKAYSVLAFSKKKYKLVSVLRLWLPEIQKHPDALLQKVRSKLKDDHAQILLDHIPFGQLIRKDGALLTVSSAEEMNNFRQLYLPKNDYRDLTILLKAKDETKALARLQEKGHAKDVDQRFDELLQSVIEHAQKWYPLSRHQSALKRLAEKADLFSALSFEKKQKNMSDILGALHANANRADLKDLKLSSWGRLQFSVTLEPTDQFIYTSYTGLYTTTVSVQELADKKLNKR